MQSKRVFDEDGIAPTLNSGSGEGMTIQPSVLQSAGFCGYASHTAKSIGYEEEMAPTLKGNDWQCQVPDVIQSAGFKWHQGSKAGSISLTDKMSPTVQADKQPAVALRTAQTGANGSGISEEVAHTVDTTGPEAVAFVGNYGGDTMLGYSEECSPTMTAKNQVDVLCMADDTQNTAIDENLSGTLKVGGGYSNGSVCNSNGSDIVGALCASDGTKGVGSQYVNQGKIICQRAKS